MEPRASGGLCRPARGAAALAGETRLNRRDALAGLVAGLGGALILIPAAHAGAPGLSISGRFVQGGHAIGRTAPRATVLLNGVPVTQASAAGWFVIGFDRDAPPQATITAETPDGSSTHEATVAAGDFDVQHISGLPPSQVSPTAPALLARIKAEGRLKALGYASRVDEDFFRTGFIMPVQATRRSARFGGQRILNGEPHAPHYGVDLAAPVGTPIVAPAEGLVSLAEPNMHYEGGLVMLDHGQGLVTVYLHMSRLDVVAGQRVRQGQSLGAVGQSGRATGPHLCWRMRWRDQNLDPTLMVAGPPLA